MALMGRDDRVRSGMVFQNPRPNSLRIFLVQEPNPPCTRNRAITKIIVQRIREVLDRLISPSQNAFVPGRKIVDNILIAQELFAGYNQRNLPKRCSLKVDLRKAYDTVEWDFLFAAMKLFEFPEPFIRWVDECVTTPTFSICINGVAHGFFKGARGLRHGDPMSPYLFVLIMEVLRLIIQQLIDQDNTFRFHWKCGEMGVFQLGFADDLLLFCEATDSSIAVSSVALMCSPPYQAYM
ncbi:UNVERIFIED_CONTAM: Retrovirus-related Pol polyprotein from type-1 retrotransposable element R2 [Sesamum latifolium]|uniref:Retrovirus-related Pol polyprotein from type-1 retrotransposable element R2 n=1 Tax=Sesamum latifolium TaxID=2727402 RepID=A0AAW2XS33_9LAMI